MIYYKLYVIFDKFLKEKSDKMLNEGEEQFFNLIDEIRLQIASLMKIIHVISSSNIDTIKDSQEFESIFSANNISLSCDKLSDFCKKNLKCGLNPEFNITEHLNQLLFITDLFSYTINNYSKFCDPGYDIITDDIKAILDYHIKLPYAENNLEDIICPQYKSFLKTVLNSECLKSFYIEKEKKFSYNFDDETFEKFYKMRNFIPLPHYLAGITTNNLQVYINNRRIKQMNFTNNENVYRVVK